MNYEEIHLKKKAALISLVIGFLMFFGKMTAYLLTGSAAIFSDALESVVHIFATSFAFYSLYLSAKPADTEHPYGHGKVEYFSAGAEGTLIIVAAISILYYAIKSLIFGIEISKLDIGVYIITAASIINLILGYYLIHTGKKTKSLVLVADGKHVLTDSVTSFGAVIALVVVLFTGWTIVDPLIAAFLGLNILWTGYRLIRTSVSGLMNEMNDEVVGKIASSLESQKANNPNWVDVHKLRYWKSGNKFVVDFHLVIPYYLSIKEGHDEMNKVQEVFKKIFEGEEVELMVHLDPCKPYYCKLCRKENCNVRSETCTRKITWGGKKIVSSAAEVTV